MESKRRSGRDIQRPTCFSLDCGFIFGDAVENGRTPHKSSLRFGVVRPLSSGAGASQIRLFALLLALRRRFNGSPI